MRRSAAPADFDTSWIRRAMVWVVALKCAGIVLIFDAAAISAFDLTKALFSHATACVLVVLLALAIFRFGLDVMPRTKLHFAVGAFVLANVVATLFAVNTFVALYGEYARYQGLTFVLDMAVLYAAVAIAFRRSTDWITLGVVGAVTVAAVVGYAIVQRTGLDPIPWAEDPRDRPFATFGNADFLGRFSSLMFGLCLGVVLFARDARPALRVVAVVLLVALTFLAGVAETRSALLGLAAAVAAAVALYALHGSGRRVQRVVLIGAGAAVLFAVLLAASPLGERARTTLSTGLGVEARLSIYRTAVSAFESRPLFGYGPDGFGVAYPSNRDERDARLHFQEPQSSAHSWVLQTLATTGVVGFAALLWVIAASTWLLWTVGMSRHPWLAGPLLIALAAYWTDGLLSVGTVGIDWFPWVALGATAAIAGQRAETAVAIRPLPAALGIAFVLTAVAVGSIGLNALSAAEEVAQARVLWLRRLPESADLAASGIRRDPGRADYWNWLGLARDLRQDWKGAADAYGEAARRAPHDSTFWANLARSRARQALTNDLSAGGGAAAIEAAQRGVSEDPNEPEANFVLGEMASLFGQPELGVRAAVTAVVLYPREPRYDPIVLRAARGAGDARFAASQLDRALEAKDTAILRVAAGELALRLGDKAAAQIHAARAQQLAPTNPDVIRLVRDAS